MVSVRTWQACLHFQYGKTNVSTDSVNEEKKCLVKSGKGNKLRIKLLVSKIKVLFLKIKALFL